jgi:hypothetical protein
MLRMQSKREHPDRARPLATERPWLAVAGCLGGGTIAVALALLLLVAALVIFFVYSPDIFKARDVTAPSTPATGAHAETSTAQPAK